MYVRVAQVAAGFVVWLANNQFWIVRTGGNPMTMAEAARAPLADADAEVPAVVRTFEP